MTTQNLLNLNAIDPSWHACIKAGLKKMDPSYLADLTQSTEWLPGSEKIFNAFSIPITQVNYVLFGESPYPRAISANGYAFWDAAVGELWSPSGLSKPVNRATSLRNILKMLLVAEGLLKPGQTSQPDITKINKQSLIQTNNEFFSQLLKKGFLLLNATPVLRPDEVRKDALAWQPFIKHVIDFLIDHRPHIQFILLGNVAKTIDKFLINHPVKSLHAEHPYNISFIHNSAVIAFFSPLHLLQKKIAINPQTS